MSPTLEKIEQQALTLPEEERAFLADRLLSSLHGSTLDEVDAAWIHEVSRRYAGFKAGERAPIAFDEVLAEAHRLLK